MGRKGRKMTEAVMGWTDDRVSTLKKLWLEGLSASQIAKQLGGVTRNAVIGKVHRLGLSGRAAPSQPQRPAFKPQRLARPAPPAPQPIRRMATAPTPPVEPVHRIEGPGSATVLTLGAHMCKWPIGDPSSEEFTFCGGRVAQGVYCKTHAELAYQPQASKKGSRSPASDLARSLRRYI
jgi:GcrA cell cycle regulator